MLILQSSSSGLRSFDLKPNKQAIFIAFSKFSHIAIIPLVIIKIFIAYRKKPHFGNKDNSSERVIGAFMPRKPLTCFFKYAGYMFSKISAY